MDIRKYVGDVPAGARIEDNTGFDTLTRERAFVRIQFTLIMPDVVRIDLAPSDYMEFQNSESGRELLEESKVLDQKYKDAIFGIWGDESVIDE